MTKLKEYKFDKLYSTSSGISSKPEQAGHGCPFVSFSIVFNNYFLPETLSELMDTTEQEQEKYSIKKGDILLTRTSETIDELGMSCVALKDYPTATFSGFVKRLRPIQKYITYDKFMGFYLRSKYFRKTMTNNAFITLRASLNEAIFSYIKISIPNYEMQKIIGDFLYLLNAKIELNNRINAELESMAKTLYDYWFVQYNFPNGKGKPYKSSGGKMVWSKDLKRRIPKGWVAGTASDVFTFNPSLSLRRGSIASYLDMGSLSTTNFMTEKPVKKQFTGGTKFQNGDVVVARITPCLENGKTGMITLLDHNEIGFGSTEFIVLRGKNKPSSGFGACFSRSDLFRKFAITNMMGTSGRKRVEAKTLEVFSMAIPPDSLLSIFEEIVAPFFKMATANTKESQTLKELRDWLLPMLMNGQVKVRRQTKK